MTVREKKNRRMSWLVLVLVPVGLLLVAGAHAHVLYVAFQSQPECVPHSKAAGEGLGYHAAKSSC